MQQKRYKAGQLPGVAVRFVFGKRLQVGLEKIGDAEKQAAVIR